MKTLIVFGTKHGCTERCAKTLSEKFDGEVDLINLKEGKNIDISQYDKVIIGDSIGGEFIFKKMKFFKVFLNPPKVRVSLSGLDILNNHNSRIKVYI